MARSTIQQCPGCGKVTRFTHDGTNLTVCGSCHKAIAFVSDKLVITEHGRVLVNLGMIQPGTTGQWENQSFTVLGRFRAWFEESVFNFWTIRFTNNELAWLAEGYGIYSILKKTGDAIPVGASQFDTFHVGDLKDLGTSVRFIVEKEYEVRKWEVEGELFIPATQFASFRIVEFANQHGKNLTYFKFGKDMVVAYEATYTSFANLQLNHLRAADYTGMEFTCKKCSNPVIVKTFPYAQSCGCPSCGARYSLKGSEFKVSEGRTNRETIYLPLGSSGKINKISYEVIGYSQKEEQNSYHSKWREYTLYNPEEGYAFLSEYDGHWIYLRETCDSPVLLNQNNRDFSFQDRQYELFNSYSYTVLDATGEFPYNLFNNGKTKVREFVHPPDMWTQESDRLEGIKWFRGTHIEPRAVRHAFNVSATPHRTGVGVVQPSGVPGSGKLFAAGVIGVMLLIIIHALIGFGKKEEILLDQTFQFQDTNTISFVTQKYVLEKRSSNLKLEIGAAVDNSWFELGATLVNAKTGKEYSMEKGVEYYYGYSEGERWTEGSQQATLYFTRIPAGTYFLQLQGVREERQFPITNFTLLVTYDVPVTRNLIWALIFLIVWPAFNLIRAYYRNNVRWSNSPFSNDE